MSADSTLEMVKDAAQRLKEAPPWEKIREAEQLGAAVFVHLTALEQRIAKLESEKNAG